MSYKLIVTSLAENDLSEIAKYIASDLSAPQAALRFIDKVENCYDNILLNPMMYPLCDNERLKSKKYRKAIINNYIMFYRIDENKKLIYIMRFVYGRSDYINSI